MQYLKAFVLLTVAFCMITAGGFFIEAKRTAHDAQTFMAESNARLKATDQNLNALLLQVGLVAANIREATDDQKAATAKTFAILQHTDILLKQTSASVKLLSAHGVQTMDELKAPLTDMDVTLQSLNRVVQDQNIPRLLADLEATSQQTSISAAHVAQTTDDIAKITHHYEVEITKPVSLLKCVSGYLLTAAKAIMIFK